MSLDQRYQYCVHLVFFSFGSHQSYHGIIFSREQKSGPKRLCSIENRSNTPPFFFLALLLLKGTSIIEYEFFLIKIFQQQTRITTKYTLHPKLNRSTSTPSTHKQQKNRSKKRKVEGEAGEAGSKTASTNAAAGATDAAVANTSSSSLSSSDPPKASLTLKTYDPVSGACLKYRTFRAAEVGRLIGGLGELGKGMAGLPDSGVEGADGGKGEDKIGDNEGAILFLYLSIYVKGVFQDGYLCKRVRRDHMVNLLTLGIWIYRSCDARCASYSSVINSKVSNIGRCKCRCKLEYNGKNGG